MKRIVAEKVVFIVSGAAGNYCGVGDYTQLLANSLQKEGFGTVIERPATWTFQALAALRQKYARQEGVCFHLQYPSFGMGKSLSPAALPLFRAPVFLTLHEFECFNVLRKLALASYALGGNRIILTNDYERGVFNRYFPFSSSKTETIPIGTNIAPPATVNPARRNRLIYFGQIRAEKGVEFFVETVKSLRASGMKWRRLLLA